MDFLNLIVLQYRQLCGWYSTGGEGTYELWLFGGLATLVLFLVVSYYLMRKALGHRKFRGTWYNEHQWHMLLKITCEDHQSGNRVMQQDEIRLLRSYLKKMVKEPDR